MMKTLIDINFRDKTALVRVDFNVTIINGDIQDATKIDYSLNTIDEILNDGGRVVLLSHFGRPYGIKDDQYSLRPIYNYLKKIYGVKLSFANLEENPNNYSAFDIVLLENLRFYAGEEKCDLDFAKTLMNWGTVYVNDAFATIHRNHASMVALPKLLHEKCSGILLNKELENANRLFNSPKKPFVIVVGGAKVKDKIAPLQALLKNVDKILLGGVVANTFMKAAGYEIGQSKYDEESMDNVSHLLHICENSKVEIVFPKDLVCVDITLDAPWPEICKYDEISENFSILDIGPYTQDDYIEIIEEAETVLWSGPMGFIENDAFTRGTEAVLYAVSEAVKSKAFTLIGGGETLTSLGKVADGFVNYGNVSTGGSALLQYIANRNQLSLKQLD